VNAELEILANQNVQQYPDGMRGVSQYFAEPLQKSNTHEVKRGLLMLMIAVTFILLIACANVANLLLSRAAARRREIALRAALGAGRSRILRQLLTESALLSIAGGIFGICVAVASFAFLKHLIPADLFYSATLHFNVKAFAFAILVCLASSVLFGLAPALQISKTDLNEALREGARGSTATRQLLGSAFVAGEIALSLMLLVGAGLLLKSLSNLRHVDPGFQPAHVLTLDFDMAEPRYRNPDVRTHFIERVLEAVRTSAGVQNAGFTGDLPLTSRGWTEEVTPENTAVWRNAPASPIYQVVTPGYLQAMGIRLIRGRFFDSRDRQNAPPVAIINLKTAQDFWPNQDAVGKRLKLGGQNSVNPWMQVIGVMGNVKHTGLADASRQEIYCPYLQAKSSLQWQRFLVVRTSGDPLGIVKQIRHIAGDLDRDEPLNHVKLLSDIVDAETQQSETQSTLLGIFAALALIMASIGIYGVMAYLVTQRTQEIGVRMALGAQKREIFGLVLKRGMKLALVGAIIGVFGAYFLTRLLRSLLFDVSPIEFGILAGVTTLLALSAVCACLVPARRAASIDPVEALRME
jgi:putative ABC transport system permease protein